MKWGILSLGHAARTRIRVRRGGEGRGVAARRLGVVDWAATHVTTAACPSAVSSGRERDIAMEDTKTGMKDGRTDGRTDGRKEGRKEDGAAATGRRIQG